jgi:hypothetical protein
MPDMYAMLDVQLKMMSLVPKRGVLDTQRM